jgi:predicted dehydrogenase
MMDRRAFLSKTAAATVGLAVRPARARAQRSPNDTVNVAIIGLRGDNNGHPTWTSRGRGLDHYEHLSRIRNVRITHVVDIDERHFKTSLPFAKENWGGDPRTETDFRRVLDDRDVDAVTIAAPDHWHALMTIWACQAGKDVYVEKPCSHNVFEGRKCVEAARRYNRIVQHGTQSRSGKGVIEGIKQINDGLIGEVYLARGLCYKWRDTIGRASEEAIPSGVNYDLWTGPAPMKPFTRNRFHYNWHWIWDTGNGDIGNQGVHEMDKARWGLGVKYPTKVSAIGGHFMFDDDQQTPNTLNAAFEFVTPDSKRKMLEFEVRHWITNSEAMIGTKAFGSEGVPAAGLAASPAADTKSAAAKPKTGPDAGSHNVIGNLFCGSKGYMAMGDYDSYKSWLGKEMEPGPSGHGAGDHYANFIDCVRNRKKEDLHAPIEEGHISCTLIHLANISYRLGRTIHFKPDTQEINGDKEAMELIHEGDRGYRDPYVVPEKV